MFIVFDIVIVFIIVVVILYRIFCWIVCRDEMVSYDCWKIVGIFCRNEWCGGDSGKNLGIWGLVLGLLLEEGSWIFNYFFVDMW